MNAGKNRLGLLVLILCLPFLLACAYLQNLIQVPEPNMEENAERVIEVLRGTDWVPLQGLTSETYTDEDYARPGTLTFTATVTNEKPIYFNYGWCTSDEATLQQNFEHIQVRMYLNDGELGEDVVHPLSYTLTDGKACLDFGILLSDWPPGTYQLRAEVIFTEPINDGFDDYDAGDYIYEYTVTVDEDAD